MDDLSAFEGADVIVLGEIHDNPAHHLNQADIVAAVAPAALVFEQIPRDLALKVTRDLIGEANALSNLLEWEARGWPDFAMYHPIFTAAPDAAIFGAEVSHGRVGRAVSEGAAAVFGDASDLFGLDLAYDDDVQADLEALQQAAHCDALPPEMLPGMVQAQRLRDAALAHATLAAHFESRGTGGGAPVVVITGNGHARDDLGAPALLAIAAPDLQVVTVGQFEEAAPDDPHFDHWLITESVDRDDPCATFRK